ncbi:hypothetical protein GTS_27490 [Gandjariella thermophila]|uniref:Uncharacterized protein n=1 Tax=Gandjariella thermophila TaxID=1931992 RepID=A0A4D4J9E7_9PSEU|nr:hypothetical protein GTS_27490 [Gandjariella thermophila]
MKVTVWWITSPGASTWPSAMGLSVENTPVGALALVIVSGTVPVLLMSKVLVTDCPTGTVL